MKRTTRNRKIASAAIAMLAGLITVPTLNAVPIQGIYQEDPRCDVIPNQTLSHELGDAAVFPPNEAFIVNIAQANTTVCVPDDGLANDWIVSITNVSGTAWKNLFFVCDHNVTVGNADGQIADLTVPGAFTDAFRIDGTVTVGINNNLLGEAIGPNEIFEPGDIWRFNVSNFMAITSAGIQPPIFISPGIFSGSTNWPVTPGNASILAVPVPEPTTVGAIVLATVGLLLRRPSRK